MVQDLVNLPCLCSGVRKNGRGAGVGMEVMVGGWGGGWRGLDEQDPTHQETTCASGMTTCLH